MENARTKPDENDKDQVRRQKNMSIVMSALLILADEINSYTDLEALRIYLIKKKAHSKEERDRDAEAIVAKAKKIVNNPIRFSLFSGKWPFENNEACSRVIYQSEIHVNSYRK